MATTVDKADHRGIHFRAGGLIEIDEYPIGYALFMLTLDRRFCVCKALACG